MIINIILQAVGRIPMVFQVLSIIPPEEIIIPKTTPHPPHPNILSYMSVSIQG